MPPTVSLRPSTRHDHSLFYAVVDQTMRRYMVETWGAWDEERVVRESHQDCRSPNARIVQVDGQDAKSRCGFAS